MSTKNIFYSFLLLVLIFPSCKKEAGIGGKKTICGTVHYKDGATGSMQITNAAIVKIAYGTNTSTTDFDQLLITDANGYYHFDGLRKGDYFITAEFTDSHGFKYVTNGYGVTANNKKEKLTVDIDLQ